MVINTTTQKNLAMVALGLAHGVADAGAAVLVVRWATSLAAHAGAAIFAYQALAVRSIVWNLVDILHQGDRSMLIYLAIAAGCGKFAGGMLAEIWGARRWGALGLTAAAACLALAGERPELLLLGVALLQSVTPVALAAAIALCPQLPATGVGMALGLAIAFGGLCSIIAPATISSSIYLAAIALTASLLLFFALKPAK